MWMIFTKLKRFILTPKVILLINSSYHLCIRTSFCLFIVSNTSPSSFSQFLNAKEQSLFWFPYIQVHLQSIIIIYVTCFTYTKCHICFTYVTYTKYQWYTPIFITTFQAYIAVLGMGNIDIWYTTTVKQRYWNFTTTTDILSKKCVKLPTNILCVNIAKLAICANYYNIAQLLILDDSNKYMISIIDREYHD